MKSIFFLLIFMTSGITYSQTPITDFNIHNAISTCLFTNPIDGMCSDSEYGSMPDWDVSNVTDMTLAFRDRSEFNADLSAWDVSNVIDMNSMFSNALAFNSDLSNWNVENVNSMRGMFFSAESFKSNLSSWNVGAVNDMSSMFWNAGQFNSDISNWDVSDVVTISAMFQNASFFKSDLSNWDVGNLIYSTFTFSGAAEFDSNLNDWNISNVLSMSSIFDDSGLSTNNYDAILLGWAQQDLMPNVAVGATGVSYCISEDARQSLIDNYGWTINDEGYDCTTVDIIEESKLVTSIYPNPTSHLLNIEGNKNELKAVVYNFWGEKIIEQQITNRIDISYLEKGVYFIKFYDGESASSHKFTKI